MAFVTLVVIVLLLSMRREVLLSDDGIDDDASFDVIVNDSLLLASVSSPPRGATCFTGQSQRLPSFTSQSLDIGNKDEKPCPTRQYVGFHRNYVVLYNYVLAQQRYVGNQSVTFCTHATYDLLPHVETVCKRWRGPVSVAVYAPGADFHSAVKAVSYLRICGSPCIRALVSFHLFFDQQHPPGNKSTLPPYTDHPIRNCQTFGELPDALVSYKIMNGLPYPINIGRNVARQMADTHYVLTADVELYPSRAVIPMFLTMIRRPYPEFHRIKPRVFVLPIFEVNPDVTPPSTKAELVRLYKGRQAVFFHKYVCPRCALTPKLVEWLGHRPSPGRMTVFYVAKRHPPFNRWEPVYIGTNKDPSYDERLTWEGRQDKMSQMHALCLMDYDLDILDNAFLVHSPGIKKRNFTAYIIHKRFAVENDRIHHQVVQQLNKKFGLNKLCY